MSSRIVVPGEVIFDSPKYIPFARTEGGKTLSTITGLFNEADLRLVPLSGPYTPNLEDVVVGVVEEIKFAGYTVNIKSAYKGFLSSKETRHLFQLGDVLSAKVKSVDEVKNVNLTEARKLEAGELIEISSVKVPRLIGKKSSMLNLLMEATHSQITVGKNGRIWVSGGDSSLAVRAVLKIEKEAHISGLTDRMKAFLSSEKG